MPFSGPNDSKLPSNVKGLSLEKRRQWVAVWNNVFAECDADTDECEARAFRAANSRVQEARMDALQIALSPRTTEANGDEQDFEGREWDVTIIGMKEPDDLVTIDGREFVRSRNGRLYSVEGLRNSTPMWEGVKVYDNHLTQQQFEETQGMRSPAKEWLGTIIDPHWREAKKQLTGVFKVVERTLAQKLKDAWEQGVLDSIGLSIDSFIIPGQDIVHEGKAWPVVEGFKKALSVDLVGDPAAGGGFNRLIASQQGETSMNEEERKKLIQDTAEAVLDALAKQQEAEEPDEEEEPMAETETPEEPEPEMADEPEEDADEPEPAQEALTRLEKLEERQRIIECQGILNKRLTEAKLTKAHDQVVRDHFDGREFKTEELNKMVKQLKEAEASFDDSGRVTEAGGGGGDVNAMLTVEEKAEAEFMRIFMGATDFRNLEKVANENDFVDERMTEGYRAWIKDGRPRAGYGNVKISEWVRTFYGDPFTGAPARVSEAVTTSSMSSIVKNTVNIMIAADYAKRNRWWEAIVRTEEVDTIDQATLVRVHGLDTLSVVNEGAAYTELSWADEEETPTFVKDGNFVGVTLEAMLRDKVNAIRTLPMRLSAAWFNTKSARAAAVFTVNSNAGPVLADTGALFNATALTSAGGHANLLTAALSLTNYGSARTAMRKQTDQTLGTGRKLQINPSYLLVPEDLETTAMQIRNSELIPGSANNDVNPHFQKFEVVTVPEWTDADDWALAADPGEWPAIWDIVLTGNRVPAIFTADNEVAGAMFTNDTLRYKVRSMSFRFSATYDCLPVGDWRPLHKNNV